MSRKNSLIVHIIICLSSVSFVVPAHSANVSADVDKYVVKNWEKSTKIEVVDYRILPYNYKSNARMAANLICIKEHYVLVTFGFGNGVGTSSIQLMEEKNGKVVPMKCK